MQTIPETQYYAHESFQVAGGTLPVAVTAYRTHGDPSNPCIVFPTCYGGRLDSQYYLVGEDKVLDPRKYFVVTFALFSNGESSSPSNTPAPFDGPFFPHVNHADNVRAQYVVLTEKLGVKKVHCVLGFSMGGQQAYHWATLYPQFVERQVKSSFHLILLTDQPSFIAICGSARTSPHNQCFIEGPKAALRASRDFNFGHYIAPPTNGIRAFGRTLIAPYPQWFREQQYKFDGKYRDLEDFMRGSWEARFLRWDANDLITLFETWTKADISLIRDNGNLEKTLKSIQVKGLIMPCKTDLYFPPEDSENEVSLLPNSKLVVIDSVWGHQAGGGASLKDNKFLEEQIGAFITEAL